MDESFYNSMAESKPRVNSLRSPGFCLDLFEVAHDTVSRNDGSGCEVM